MNVELHLLVNGVDKGPLPSYQQLQVSPVFCDIGAISFKYPKAGKRFGLIEGKDELEIVPWINGVAQPKFGGYVNQINGDDTNDAAVLDFSGQMYLRRLDEIRVYPKNWPTFDPTDPSFLFSARNAGFIVRSLLNAAANRGTGTDITWSSFTELVDSNGQAWAKGITLEVKPGATVLDVMQSMFANNMVEFEMVGKDLRMYNYGTLSADRTTGPGKPLVFRRGRDLTDSPRKVSSRDVATVLLGAGKDDKGLYHEEVDATAVAGRRRIEGYVSNGNIIESGTLDAFTEASLGRLVNAKMEKTHGLALSGKKTPKPIDDFNIGDWAFSDTGKGLEKLRIKQWVINVNADGKVTGSVTLNDLIAEQNANLSRRIDGIIGGSTLTGESKAVDVLPGEVLDGVPPSQVVSLGLASAPFTDAEGHTFAQVTATWPQVTTNNDGTILTDLWGYTIRWAYTANPTGWNMVDQFDNATIMQFSPVAPGVQIWAQIRAFDKYSNPGPWSPLVSHTTQDDATDPEKPATPVADNYMGLIRVTFSGKTLSGAAWAPDVVSFRVHASTISDFTPDASTWVDTLTGANNSYIDPGYGQSRFIKIVAVDRNGNQSVPSNQAQATTSRILADDIFAGAVGTAALADAVITSAKIANLAVNDAHMGSVSAAKITTGVLNAQVTVSGRLCTALNGRRSEMNGIGFQSWNILEQLTVSLDGENNLLMGTFKTALSGRRIEMSAGGSSGVINFIGPDGRLGRIRGFTATLGDVGDEAMEMGIPVANTWGGWNSFSVNLDEEIFMESGFTVLTGGGNGTGLKGLQLRYANNRGTPTAPVTSWVRVNITGSQTHINSPAGATRVLVDDGGVTFYPNGNGNIEVYTGDHANDSAHLIFQNESGTYSGRIRYQYVADTYGHRFEIRNAADSGYLNHLAATHYNLSDARTKENVRELKKPARELMKKARGKLYSYKHEKDDGSPLRFGVMAQDLPPELAQPDAHGNLMVSPMAVASMAVNMIHEIEEELAQVRSELAELKGN